MADEDYSGVYAGSGPGEVAKPVDDGGPTFGDYLKTAGSSALTGVLAPAAASVRASAENDDRPGHGELTAHMSKVLQGYLNTEGENIDASRTESAKKRAAAAVTSSDFWEHPVSASALKLTGMTGPVAAMVFSGGPVGSALVGGALSSGSYLNDLDKALDGATDEQLKENEWYGNLRSMGMSEKLARADLKNKLLDNKVAFNFAAGAIAGALGPAGKLAGKIGGKASVGLADAESGVLARTGAGAAEGALGGGLQGATNNATLQQSEVNAGLKKGFDEEALVNAVLEPSALGGVMGGAVGAVAKPKGKTKKASDAAETEVTQEPGRGAEAAPVEAQPARPAKEADVSVAPAKHPDAKAPQEVTPDIAPDVLAAMKPDPVAPPDVAAAAKEVAAPPVIKPDLINEAPAKPVTPEVTPEIPAEKSVVPPTPPEPVAPAPAAPPDVVGKPTGRVLKDMSVEGRANAKAVKDQVKKDAKAAAAEVKEAGKRKDGEDERKNIAERDAAAKEIFDTHHEPYGEVPDTRKERLEMAAKVDKVLAAAAERGLVDRAALPEKLRGDKRGTVKGLTPEEARTRHLSVPSKTGAASDHVMYLRELMQIKKVLEGQKYGPDSDQRRRVADFITEHNAKDLTSMRARRKEVGALMSVVHQGDVEAPSGKVAEAMAGGDHVNESTMSPEDLLMRKQEADKSEEAAKVLAAAKEGRVSDEEAAATKEAEAEAAAKEKFARQRAARKAAMKSKEKLASDTVEEIKAKAREAAEAKAAAEAEAAAKPKDTSGVDRSKYNTTMTPEQLAAFKEAKAAKAAKAAEPKGEDALVDRLEEKPRAPIDINTNEPIKPLKTMTVREALKSLDLQHLSGVPKALADFAKKRLQAVVGDRQVHVLTQADMARATGDEATAHANSAEGVTGEHMLYRDGSGGRVHLRHDALRTPQQTAHTVLHEITHAETSRALLENPVIHKRVSRMMGEVHEALKSFPADIRKAMDYAMTNPREFMAEGGSNPVVQEILTHIRMSDALAKELRLDVQKRNPTMWDGMIAQVREIIESLTGRLPDGHRMIEGILRAGENIEYHNRMVKEHEGRTGAHLPLNLHGLEDNVHDSLNLGPKVEDKLIDLKGWARRKLNRANFSSAIGDGRHAELSGPGLNKVVDAGARKNAYKDHVLAHEGGRELVARQAELERTHPEAFAEGNDLGFDASTHMVNPEPGAVNDFGTDATKYWQAKKELPGLQKRFEKLAEKAPEVAKMMSDTAAFFKRIHEKISMDTLNSVLKAANIDEAGLAERIYKDGLTEADLERWGKDSALVSALNDATDLKELKGWYIPFRRYGNWISTGSHELTTPANGTKINDHTIQFYDNGKDAAMRRAAEAYVNQSEHTSQGNKLVQAGVDRVWVDAKDPTKIVDSSDVDAKAAYRVRMQTQHTEFHESESEARRNEDVLKEAGLTNTKVHLREDAHRATPGMEGALGTVARSLEHTASYQKLDQTQKDALMHALAQASVRSLSSTNIKTSMAHRRNVAGMSRDLTRVTSDYARMSANHLANIKFGPEIAEGFAEMREHMKAYENDKNNVRRQEIYQELHGRAYGKDAMLADRAPNPVLRKLLQVSRAARLAGVSFHVINSMEPLTTSLPWIAGRHGPVATTKAILEAYNTIGGLGAIRAGLKDTVKAYTRDNGFTDYVQMFKDNIAKSNAMGGEMAKTLMEGLDYANERGLWGNDAIFEVGKSADPTGNIGSRALDRIDLMANQVGSAVEANNRAVTFISALKLELKKNGGNKMAAMDYAYKTAVTTMGDYSHTNASPIFNTRAGQVALQFKKFAVKSYNMLGTSMAGALRGDPEAAKQFIGLMVTHAVVAGALGIPGLEPFKIALMASNAFGITGYNPGDFDNDVRQMTARVFGKKGGEIVSHGVFRGAGIEVSNRMGWDNLLTYGNPKSNKPNDIKSWLWDTMAGAPAGYILDQFASGQALMKAVSGEDVAKNLSLAIQKSSPIRAVSDIAKAYSGVSDYKKSPTGVKQHAPLSAYETGIRAIGFTPSSTAEDGAMRGAYASDSKKVSDARSAAINAWVNAEGAAKVSAQRAVQKFNTSNAAEAAITPKDLANAAKRRASEEEKGTVVNGIRINKRTKEIYNQSARTYNP